MSNLEHLVENGLVILENGYSSEEWFNRMSADINWEYVENITVDDLWEICQYVFYTWADRKTEPQNCDDCIWSVCNYNKAFEDEPQTESE